MVKKKFFSPLRAVKITSGKNVRATLKNFGIQPLKIFTVLLGHTLKISASNSWNFKVKF